MTVVDASHVPTGDVLEADVCVIGSGAAGLTVAHQLDGGQRRVVVLEAGGNTRDLATEEDSFALTHHGVPHANPIDSRGRMFGGSTSLWYGRIARPDPIDFEQREWVPASGWPMRLEDLDSWMQVASSLLDVRHDDKLDVSNWPTNPTIESFGHSTATDVAAFLWAGEPNMGRRFRRSLEDSKNVQLITHATATRIVASESHRVDHVEVCGAAGHRFTVKSKAIVLACGGLENPRMLLASGGSRADGFGNEHDQVGRHLMDHPRGEGLAMIDLRSATPGAIDQLALLDEHNKMPFGATQLRVVFPEARQRREGLLNHSLHGYLLSAAHGQPGFEALKRLRSGRFERPRDAIGDVTELIRGSRPLIGLGVDRLLRRSRPSRFVVVDQLEQPPDARSRVSLRAHDNDRFGLPRLDVEWRIDASVHRSLLRMHETFRDALVPLGIEGFSSSVLDQPERVPEYIDMKHPSGTTRMSASPRNGVVDAECRVHGLSNLYVCGSSVFPTVGHFNPTYVIVALAARLAAHLDT